MHTLILQNDPSAVELAYYRDASKKEKRQSINLTQFVGIRPNAKVGTNEHVFAIETEERKYILKAPDQSTKNIWLAKLCELCGQGELMASGRYRHPSILATRFEFEVWSVASC